MTEDRGREARRRGAGRARGAVAVAAGLALAAGACDEPRASPQLVGSGQGGPSVGATPGAELPDVPASAGDGGPRQVGLLQVAALPDSAAATRLRDSLADAGWRASVRAVTGDSLPPWRVRVAPTEDRELLQLVAAAWSGRGRAVRLVADTASPQAPTVRAHAVNGGARGVRGAVRWTLAPDRRALLVVEDPVGAGGLPLPDGFLYAADGRPGVTQRDSVWDVSPDPAWRQVAYGQGFLVRVEGRDVASALPWHAISWRTNLEPTAIRRAVFQVGADSTLQGFAQPVIEPLAEDSTAASLRRTVSSPVPMAGGWRVRWSADAEVLAVGQAPDPVASDDAAPARWVGVDTRTRLARVDVPSNARLTSPAWTSGPALVAGGRVDRAARRLPIAGGEVASAGGWITARGTITGGAARVIGPGTALAATAGGQFVAALVPAVGAGASDPALRVVVYELQR